MLECLQNFESLLMYGDSAGLQAMQCSPATFSIDTYNIFPLFQPP